MVVDESLVKAVAAYNGPVTVCKPGRAKGLEQYEGDPLRKCVRPDAARRKKRYQELCDKRQALAKAKTAKLIENGKHMRSHTNVNQKKRKAENPHRRKRWQMQRQDAATTGMSVVQVSDGWNVTGPNGMCAGPFATQAEAFRWLDKIPAKRYGAAR
jgi:hypothetical protein